MKNTKIKMLFLLVALAALMVASASAELIVSGTRVEGPSPEGGILGACVAELDGKLFAVGQYGFGAGQENSKVYMSEDGVNWTLATSAPGWRGRIRPGLVTFKDKLYLIGGIPSSGGNNDVWSSEDGINWTEVTSDGGFTGRGNIKPVVKDGRIWIMGGMQAGDSNFQKDVWYSEDGETWVQATDDAPWGPRAGHTSVVVGNEILVFGGAPVGGGSGWNVQGYTDVWASVDGATWTTKTETMTKHVLTDACVIGNSIVVYGGASGDGIWDGGDIISVSDDAGATWTDYLMEERMMDSAVAYFKGRLAVVGGNDLPAWNIETAEMNRVFDIPDFAARPKIYAYIDGGADGDGLTPATAIRSNMNNAINLIRDGLTSGIICTASGTINRTLGAKELEANNDHFDEGRSYTVVGGLEFNPSTAIADIKWAGETVMDFADSGTAKFLKCNVRGSASNPARNLVNMYNLTFNNMGADGAVFEVSHKDSAAEGNYNFAACNFEGGNSTSGPGLRWSEGTSPSNMILTDCEFVGNHATGGGAAIFGNNVLTLGIQAKRCTFDGNTSDDNGGAIYIHKAGGSSDPTDWVFEDCTITSNSANVAATTAGGFLYFKPGLKPHLQMIDSLIHNNHTGGRGGGAIATENSGTACNLTIDGCTVTSNSCTSGGDLWGDLGGGAILWDRDDAVSQVNLVDSYFGFNRSAQNSLNKYGSGVMPVTCGLDVEGCTFEGNWALNAGGCFAVFGLTGAPDAIQVRDSYFIGNSVGDNANNVRGGAILNWAHQGNLSTDLDFTNCVFAYNVAYRAEGALINIDRNDGDLSTDNYFNFTNCSFVGNRSIYAGNGDWRCIFENSGHPSTMEYVHWGFFNCLFAENQTLGAVGLWQNLNDGNDYADNCYFYNTKNSNDGTNNWHWHTNPVVADLIPTNSNLAAGQQGEPGVDPVLANLVAPTAGSETVFGLGTPVTDFMQLTSSTLIDAGADTHTSTTLPMADYRGLSRPQNLSYDIGAFEVKAPIELIVDSLTVDFGTWDAGESTTTLVGLTGAANGDVSISSVTLVSGDTDAFSISGAPTGVAANGSADFTVGFAPTVAMADGPYTAVLEIQGDGSNMPIQVTLTGDRSSRDLTGPGTVSAGSVVLGESSISNVTLTASINGPVAVNSITIISGDTSDFTVNSGITSIGVGSAASFSVTFTPTSEGVKSVIVEVDSDAQNSPIQITVTGTGLPGLDPASADEGIWTLF